MNQTENNILELRKLVKSGDKRVAAFIGAGLSIGLGIESWKDIIIELAKHFKTDPDIIEERKRGRTYPQIASNVCRGFKNDKEYKEYLATKFKPKDNSDKYKEIHQRVISVLNIILTTNYDTSFEHAFNMVNEINERHGNSKINYSRKKLPNFLPDDLTQSQPVIVYLHGNNDEQVYVFKEEEYKLFYPDNYGLAAPSRLQEFLKFVFKNYNLIFIGFSFDDDDFIKYFSKIRYENKIEVEIMRKNISQVLNRNDLLEDYTPNNYVIISDKEIKQTLTKEQVLSVIDDNSVICKIFRDNNGELELLSNYKENIKTIQDNNIINKIEGYIDKILENKRRDKFFEEMDIKRITFEGDKYDQIKTILEKLKEKETSYVGNESELERVGSDG